MLIKLNEEYGKDVPYLVQCFKRNAVPTETDARTVLSTAHKAKGLDFDHVTVGEDFECLESAQSELMNAPDMTLSPLTVQEINLLYVTFTRARHQLDLNTESRAFFSTYEQRLSALVEARGPAREAAVPTP
jgi:superfamily I DNA/RNA helicase